MSLPGVDGPPQEPVWTDLPTHELLALDAVARLGSLQEAADELSITPSAISHRLSSLEGRLGRPLLRRRGRGVVLTEQAEQFVDSLGAGFSELAAATQALLEQEHRVIRIVSAPAVAASWLLPMLQRHAQLDATLRYELVSVATLGEAMPCQWDLLLHYGDEPRRGSRRHALFSDRLVWLCAPPCLQALASAQAHSLPLLRLAQLETPRQEARAAFGCQTQIVFDDAIVMLEAAAAGAGVTLATETAAAPFLRCGRLVQATAQTHPGQEYFLDLSESGQRKLRARSLYEWLVRQEGLFASP
ncbi:LysR family transcriptional regulator [Ideonella sp. BN130291]|uniref:LysR family transcriptional regulator n=1 Tax=Ideonella sp. BN130291 TaxID=3112940 RepID=UPI002E2640EE|nr:LysR family transcriptional regulator [Ideonella sp. BN130291]